jgi:hypothetical protein
MGRGRQKAKQTKVARKLKYYTPDTDYRALERELSGAGTEASEDDFEYESYPAEDDDDWEPDR